MKPYNQFRSALNQYEAILIDERNIGCDFIFHINDLKTGLRVGQYNVATEEFTAFGCDTCQTANQLRELAALCSRVKNNCLKFLNR